MIRSKELSPLELMEETLKRIYEVNPELNAFVTLRADEAWWRQGPWRGVSPPGKTQAPWLLSP